MNKLGNRKIKALLAKALQETIEEFKKDPTVDQEELKKCIKRAKELNKEIYKRYTKIQGEKVKGIVIDECKLVQ